MDRLKPLVGLIIIAGALWWLYPHRQLAGPGESGVVEITFMGPADVLASSWIDAASEFERDSAAAHAADPSKPRYRIIFGQSAARNPVADPTRFLLALAGGAPPDVIYFDRYAVAEWAARGAFKALDGYIARDRAAKIPDTPEPERYYKTCWDEATYHGKTYGIPVSIDARALIYNKDLFVRAGILDEHGRALPPRTWSELLADSVKLTERDDKGRLVRAGFAPRYGESWLHLYAWNNGGQLMSADGTRCTMADPRNAEALAFMRDLYDAIGGYKELMGFQAGFQDNELDPFIQTLLAMKVDVPNFLNDISRFGPDVDFGVAPIPIPDEAFARGQKPTTLSGGWALAIPVNSRHADGAWQFIRFMSSDRAAKIRLQGDYETARAQGHVFIPTLQPKQELNEWTFAHYIYDSLDVPQRIQDACREYNKLLPDARHRPVTPVGQLLWNEHVRATDAALYHTLSPHDALAIGDENVQRALDRILKPVPGRTISSWTWFYILYGVLIAATAFVVWQWDRGVGLRRWFGTSVRPVSGSVYSGRFRRRWIGGYVCASPWIVGFIVFGGGPMLFSLIISFCDYDVLNPARFTGLSNYRVLVAGDDLVPLALWNTLYMVIAVPIGMAVGLGMAILLNQKIRGIRLWRTCFFLPAIVPMVGSTLLWVWIFNPQGGLLNLMLSAIGIHGPNWLGSPAWSKPSLILMGLWSAGSGMIIWLAGLEGIPQSFYEAAAVDGASLWQQFTKITIPQLTPYIFFNLVMGLIGTFQIFVQAFIMTQGGPVNSTLFYVYHLFNQAFRYGNMGYASALAWVLFLIVLGLTIVQLKLSRRWVYYESDTQA